jgi:heme/copper-type cytochrome/quinol oxidase subunit 1
MFKLLLLTVFGGIVLSLFTALYFLIKDTGSSQRTVNALLVRVALSLVLVGLLLFGLYGDLL